MVAAALPILGRAGLTLSADHKVTEEDRIEALTAFVQVVIGNRGVQRPSASVKLYITHTEGD